MPYWRLICKEEVLLKQGRPMQGQYFGLPVFFLFSRQLQKRWERVGSMRRRVLSTKPSHASARGISWFFSGTLGETLLCKEETQTLVETFFAKQTGNRSVAHRPFEAVNTQEAHVYKHGRVIEAM